MKAQKRVSRKKMTFNQIVAKTIREKKFLSDLVKCARNPKRVLDARGILLSKNDQWKLTYLLTRSFSMKGPQLIRLSSGILRSVSKVTFPPPPPWPPYTPEFRDILSRIPNQKKPREKRRVRK